MARKPVQPVTVEEVAQDAQPVTVEEVSGLFKIEVKGISSVSHEGQSYEVKDGVVSIPKDEVLIQFLADNGYLNG